MTTKMHVLFVTDRSGSMHPLAEDVCGGFNSYINDLRLNEAKNTGGDDDVAYEVSVTLFDTIMHSLCASAALGDVPAFDDDNYQPRGSTALLDAVGHTIEAFREKHPTLSESDRVVLVIQTDGEENSSRRYTYDDVRAMLRRAEADGWTLAFLGQDEKAWAQGQNIGLGAHSIVKTNSSKGATRSSYGGLSGATVSLARATDVHAVDFTEEVRTTPGVVADEQKTVEK